MGISQLFDDEAELLLQPLSNLMYLIIGSSHHSLIKAKRHSYYRFVKSRIFDIREAVSQHPISIALQDEVVSIFSHRSICSLHFLPVYLGHIAAPPEKLDSCYVFSEYVLAIISCQVMHGRDAKAFLIGVYNLQIFGPDLGVPVQPAGDLSEAGHPVWRVDADSFYLIADFELGHHDWTSLLGEDEGVFWEASLIFATNAYLGP